MDAAIKQHMAGKGCEWTRVHEPYKVIKRIITVDPSMERSVTLGMMKRYSWRRVRGAEWQDMEINRPEELANPVTDRLLAGNYYMS